MKNPFKKGLILGSLLATAAAVGFVTSKEGKELSKDVQNDLNILAKRVKKSLHALRDVTKDAFDAAVDAALDTYQAQKEMTSEAKAQLAKALRAKWHEMEAEYLSEKDA